MKLLTTKMVAEILGYKVYTVKYSRISGRLGGKKAPKHVNMNEEGDVPIIRYTFDSIKEWAGPEGTEFREKIDKLLEEI